MSLKASLENSCCTGTKLDANADRTPVVVLKQKHLRRTVLSLTIRVDRNAFVVVL